MVRVLFVCLGNICRSPVAAAVFRRLVTEAGLADAIAVDSAGTGDWHVGEPAHPGSRALLARHGLPTDHRARQVRARDLEHADHIVVMDKANREDLLAMARGGPPLDDRVHLLLDFAPPGGPREVPDPYFEGNFDEVYALVEAGAQGLLDYVRARHGL